MICLQNTSEFNGTTSVDVLTIRVEEQIDRGLLVCQRGDNSDLAMRNWEFDCIVAGHDNTPYSIRCHLIEIIRCTSAEGIAIFRCDSRSGFPPWSFRLMVENPVPVDYVYLLHFLGIVAK